MKINRLIIENFKGVSRKLINFEEDKIFALVGSNGKGKTSFIEAIK